LLIHDPVAFGVVGEPSSIESVMGPLSVFLIGEEMAGPESRRRWSRIDAFVNVGESPVGDWSAGAELSVLNLSSSGRRRSHTLPKHSHPCPYPAPPKLLSAHADPNQDP